MCDGIQQNKSGLYSLGGFAYQIKVFVCEVISMNENMVVEFETIDDVATKKLENEIIDENEDKFRTLKKSEREKVAIQVKRTKVSNSVAKKIILNWFLLEYSTDNISKYKLVTDAKYENDDVVLKILNSDIESLYKEVMNTTTNNSKSVFKRVKNKIYDNQDKFYEVCKSIKDKYIYEVIDNIDLKLCKTCKVLFKKCGVSNYIYISRIKEMLQHITYHIIESANKGHPYKLTYKEFMAYSEDICNRITDNHICSHYSEFKKNCKIDLENSDICKTREYRQLVACNLSSDLIKNHLIYELYYSHYRMGLLEINKTCTIDDLETEAYENFNEAKFDLMQRNEDNPYNRLIETKRKLNSYACNKQIKFGSEIYLTKEKIEQQISWKDEDDD